MENLSNGSESKFSRGIQGNGAFRQEEKNLDWRLGKKNERLGK